VLAFVLSDSTSDERALRLAEAGAAGMAQGAFSSLGHSPGAIHVYDVPDEPTEHLGRDLTCPHCGHSFHTFLACDRCNCPPVQMPGAA
jgi:hypothetical protein